MLSNEEIETNARTFRTIIRNEPILFNLCGTKELLIYLEESDFYYAPASTQYHGAYNGGLCEHSLSVYYNILKLSDMCKFEKEYTLKTLTLISLLHDVCKINCYSKEVKSRKVKDEKGKFKLRDNGKPEWENIELFVYNDMLPLGHGEKSVIILQQYYTLSIDEIMAIRWHMGGYDEMTKSYIGNLTINKAFNNYPIIALLHTADMMSIFLKVKDNEIKDEVISIQDV